ncbi:hypothetical protein KIM372_12910 [Bombiscardovia nodaiensis]|uniref:RCC1-like domain-containing protein n=1 Tax=Bombiscardovia nodaiensis TaxID=2932181 RepID=A0ABN6SBC0_9BIFI|nr:hypothetical protein KIM372_12910 [Bombiscardovia nodaiensis]
MYGWGDNVCGQLGTTYNMGRDDGWSADVPVTTPQRAQTSLTFVSADAGYDSTVTLAANGVAYACGENDYGQLGNGSSDSDGYGLHPYFSAVSTNARFTTISSLGGVIVAIATDGTAYGWGWASDGQLGNYPPQTMQKTPVPVSDPTVTIDYAMFDNRYYASATQDPVTKLWHIVSPAHAEGAVDVVMYWKISGAQQPEVTFKFTYKAPRVVSFELNGAPGTKPANQQVPPNGHVTWPNPTPTWDKHWFDGWFTSGGKAWDFDTPVSADMTLTAKWEVYQFSMNPNHGSTNGSPTAITPPAAPTGIRFMQVSAGDRHTLAIGSDGNAYAWGNNTSGQLGTRISAGGTATAPERVRSPAGVRFTQVSAGGNHSLAIDSRGHAWAWGWNYYGQVGVEDSANQPIPVDLSAAGRLPTNIVQVSAGGWHSLAIDTSGHVWVWGLNQNNQLGITANAGNYMPNKTPTDLNVSGRLPAGISQVSAGAKHSLAIDANKHVWAWGDNVSAQLGLLAGSSGAAPTDLNAAGRLTAAIIKVSAGNEHTLAIDTNGHAWSWGNNRYGQLGHTTNSGIILNVYTLTDLSAAGRLPAGISDISAGDSHSLAIDSSGHTWSWGSNESGQLGVTTNNGNTQANPTPIDLNAGGRLSNAINRISAGGSHSAAIDSDQQILVWGDNNYGQQADGTISNVSNPAPRQPNPQKLIITGVKFDQTELNAAPTWDSTNHVWKLTSPAHTSGAVTTSIHWTLGGTAQIDYPLPYTYEWPLPAAGAIPLQRLSGGALLALSLLSAAAYVAYQLARKRK